MLGLKLVKSQRRVNNKIEVLDSKSAIFPQAHICGMWNSTSDSRWGSTINLTFDFRCASAKKRHREMQVVHSSWSLQMTELTHKVVMMYDWLL